MAIPPGISLKAIADLVGVSTSTVSRALNGSDRVSPLTKQAVQGAITQLTRAAHGAAAGNGAMPTRPMLGITPSHLPGGPAKQSLDVIMEQVLGGIEDACLRAGYIPYPWQRSGLLLTDEAEPFFQSVSGVVMSGGIVERGVLAAIRAHNLPVVIVGGRAPDLPVPSVAADGQRGTYLATQHLLGLGHRRIALVNGPAETYTSFEKRAGYVTAMAEARAPIDPALLRARDGYSGFDVEAAEELTEALLDLTEPPTAIVYAADHMAAAGSRVCHRRGLHIPNDISIVGFHDDHDAESARPTLTTVRVDRELWGEVAAGTLVKIIGGEPMRGTRLLLPVELIVRQSTGPVPRARRR